MKLPGESGQVAVEQALVMPLMVFLILGMVQLTMMQQARIMAEYAVFNAARAGAVYNGDPKVMTWAAAVSLLPTEHRTDSFGNFTKQVLITAVKQGLASALATLGITDIPSITGIGLVKVTILNPKPSVFSSAAAKHLDYQQIDFDDIRDGQGGQPDVVDMNLLSIRLRYFYKLRIPFANELIDLFWMASQVGALDRMASIDFVNPESPLGGGTAIAGQALAQGKEDLRLVAAGFEVHKYYFPITTYYTIRMQSNLYKKNVVAGSK